MESSLTPEERARIAQLQDQLIERFLHHRRAVKHGKEDEARVIEMEIDDLLREKRDIEAWAVMGSA
jgi:hypothetical protein